MAPPSYSDLGKAARDVFNSGYVFDVLKLDLKTNQNVEIKAGGTQHLTSGAVNANLETKYVFKKSNYCESWVEPHHLIPLIVLIKLFKLYINLIWIWPLDFVVHNISFDSPLLISYFSLLLGYLL